MNFYFLRSFSPSKFPDFMKLPNEIQAEVISFCDFNAKLNLSETCSHLNELIFSTPKLNDNIQLKIDCFKGGEDENAYILKLMEKLFIISNNGRKYSKLWLFRLDDALYSVAKSLLLRNLRDVGASVKDLHVLCGKFRGVDLSKIFKLFTNVEKLKVQNGKLLMPRSEEIRFDEKLMPKLTELSLKFSATTKSRVFRGVKGLKTLKLKTYYDDYTDQLDEFSSFLSNQTELENLVIQGTGANGDSVLKVLKVVMELKSLKSLEILRVENLPDMLELGNLTNPSVKSLKFHGNDVSTTQMLQTFLRIFPNLQLIDFSFMTIFNIEYEMLKTLPILKGVSPKGINYQPSHFHFDPETSEKNLQKFICQSKMAMNLTIGDESWIRKEMGFSTKMWIPILQNCYLHTVKIYNPLKVDELVELFLTNKTRMYSLEVYTTIEGKQSTDQMILPNWLKVYVV